MKTTAEVNLVTGWYMKAMTLGQTLSSSLSGHAEAGKFADAIAKLKSHAGTSCVGTTAVDADALREVLGSGIAVVTTLGTAGRENEASQLAAALIDMFDPKMRKWAPEIDELRQLWIKYIPISSS